MEIGKLGGWKNYNWKVGILSLCCSSSCFTIRKPDNKKLACKLGNLEALFPLVIWISDQTHWNWMWSCECEDCKRIIGLFMDRTVLPLFKAFYWAKLFCILGFVCSFCSQFKVVLILVSGRDLFKPKKVHKQNLIN